jgi:serine O-acetyltransferase
MTKTPARRAGGAEEVGLLTVLREDLQLHWSELSRPGFQALVAYRLGHGARRRRGGAPPVLGRLSALLARFVRRRFGIELDAGAKLGRRLNVGHQGGIHIGPDVTMGDDCVILQGVRIGCSAGVPGPGPGPRIGDRVHIGARAVVIGDVHIGDDARIGPNVVVTEDVTARVTAIARPSRVQKRVTQPAAADRAGSRSGPRSPLPPVPTVNRSVPDSAQEGER